MSARPVKLDVLGRTYAVRSADLTRVAAYGTCDGDAGVISIDPVACGSTYNEQDTLLHECMHAVLRQQGRAYTKAEERYVTALATGTLALLRNNPALVRYLMKNK